MKKTPSSFFNLLAQRSRPRIDAGEIGSDHTVTALYELTMVGTLTAEANSTALRYQHDTQPSVTLSCIENSDFANELAFVKIRYKEPDGVSSKLLQYPIEVLHINKNGEHISNDFRFAAAVSYFAQQLRRSQYAGSYTFEDITALAEKAKGKDRFGYRQEFIELVINAALASRTSK